MSRGCDGRRVAAEAGGGRRRRPQHHAPPCSAHEMPRAPLLVLELQRLIIEAQASQNLYGWMRWRLKRFFQWSCEGSHHPIIPGRADALAIGDVMSIPTKENIHIVFGALCTACVTSASPSLEGHQAATGWPWEINKFQGCLQASNNHQNWVQDHQKS